MQDEQRSEYAQNAFLVSCNAGRQSQHPHDVHLTSGSDEVLVLFWQKRLYFPFNQDFL